VETNQAGATVSTQWFERARFEVHPENQPPFNVLLGLLGNEIRANTVVTPAPPTTPPPTETPPANTATSCNTLPTATNGAFALVRCGPAGLELAAAAPMQPNEEVEIKTFRPDGTGLEPFRGKARADGTALAFIYTSPDTKLGQLTISFKGLTSGKTAEVYFWLEPSVSRPTIIVSPDPGKLDQLVAFALVGFKGTEKVRVNVKTPQALDTDLNVLFTTSPGGGYTFWFTPLEAFTPTKYIVPGEWFMSAVAVDQETRFATVKFTLTK
jgi:hypothetical protein